MTMTTWNHGIPLMDPLAGYSCRQTCRVGMFPAFISKHGRRHLLYSRAIRSHCHMTDSSRSYPQPYSIFVVLRRDGTR